MKPILNKILVEIINENVTKGGIILPNATKPQNKGKVLAVGPKAKVVKEGDTIIFHEHVGTPINYLGKDCLFLSEEPDVITVL